MGCRSEAYRSGPSEARRRADVWSWPVTPLARSSLPIDVLGLLRAVGTPMEPCAGSCTS
ncbi:Uncharacterised protein [Mycobacteroides abscessus subsp. abscessus]|nr:Uncharacterised protein [Mycobacteroides abscessus subsp. abscessus]